MPLSLSQVYYLRSMTDFLVSSHNYVMIRVKSGNWRGFKIVGDNLDKKFRRTHQWLDFQTVSHLYFYVYGVKDRVDLQNVSHLCVIDIRQLLQVTMTV